MSNENVINGEGFGRKLSESDRSVSRNFLAGIEEKHETLCQDSRCSLPAGAMTHFRLNNSNCMKCITHFYLHFSLL